MATVRAQRLLNSVTSGTTTGAQLQSLLATASNLSDWQQVLYERGKVRLLTNNTLGIQATFQSVLALEQYLNSPVCSAEYALSTLAQAQFSQYGAPTVAASSVLMDAYFSSSPNIDAFRSTRSVGATLIQSQFFPAKASSVPLASSSVWKMPYSYTRSVGLNVAETDWNGSTVVAIGANLPFNSATAAALSTNGGVTFTPIQISASVANNLKSIAFGAGLFVIVGEGGQIFTSPTGLAGSWTSRTSGTSNDLLRIRYANGIFVAIGSASTVLYSSNGITWSSGSGLFSNTAWVGLVYTGSNTWVACNSSAQTMSKSTNNGVTWSNITGPFNGNSAMDYGNGQIIVGGSSGNVSISNDLGGTWSTAFVPGSLNTSWAVYSVAYWNGVWCFGQYASGGNVFSTSTVMSSSSTFFSQTAGGANLVPNTSAGYILNGLQVRNGRLFFNVGSSNNLVVAWNS